MGNCNEFEVAVEMLLHGALAREDEAALAVHLASCPSCRAFERVARSTEKTMTTHALSETENVNWDTLFLRMKESIGRSTRERVIAGAVVLVASTSMMMLINPGTAVLAESLLAALLLGAVWLTGRRKIAEVARQRGDAGELLFLHRVELEQRLHAARRAACVLPALVPFCFYVLRGLLVSTQAWIGFGGMVCMIAGALAYVLKVRLPGLRRELAAFKNAGSK